MGLKMSILSVALKIHCLIVYIILYSQVIKIQDEQRR